MGAIEDFAAARRGGPRIGASVWRGSVTNVLANGMVYVQIPRFSGIEPVGPLPTAVTGLIIGSQVIVAAIGGRQSEMMVVSTADGAANWQQLPDLSIVPVEGADMDLFNAKGVALVSDDAASTGLNFPAPVGGLAEAWSRSTGEGLQRYSTFDGRSFVRARADTDLPWSDWESPSISQDDIEGATATGKSVLSAATANDIRVILGLQNVDNTRDVDKPVPESVAAFLRLLAPIDEPHFTGNVTGISKVHVGLDQVDNTPDLKKPVSESVQAILTLKADKAGPTFTGTLTSDGPAVFNNTVAFNNTGVTGLTKTTVGLANVDNTTDLNKPVSTATQNALNLKANIASPTFTGTVSGITKAMVGLGVVDNTSDADKPLSTAAVNALANKSDTTHSHALLDSATSLATANTLAYRDSVGRISVGTPGGDAHAVTRLYASQNYAPAFDAWVPLTLDGVWVNYSGGGGYLGGLRYRLGINSIQIQGMVKNGAIGSTITSELPTIPYTHLFPVVCGNSTTTRAVGYIVYSETGVLTYDNGVTAPTFVAFNQTFVF